LTFLFFHKIPTFLATRFPPKPPPSETSVRAMSLDGFQDYPDMTINLLRFLDAPLAMRVFCSRAGFFVCR
jgi:hypothetical protein